MSLPNRFTIEHITDKIMCYVDELTRKFLGGKVFFEKEGMTFDISDVSMKPITKYRIKKGKMGYEEKETEYIKKYINRGDSIIDLGAGIGVTSCVAARVSGVNGLVVSVEANPVMEKVIRRNSHLNGVGLHIIISAYSNKDGKVSIGVGRYHVNNGLYNKEKNYVKSDTINIYKIIERYNIGCFSLVSDIEGSEAEMVEEIGLLENKCKTMIIEMHSKKNTNVNKFIEEISKSSFREEEKCGNIRVYKNKKY